MTGATAISDLIQIIYSSQPFGFDDAILSSILLDARRCNTRDGVTGALVCRHDIYLQYLEGPRPAVEAAVDRIRRDDRHLDVRVRLSEPIEERIFGDWAMLHDPAKTWIWPPEEIHGDILDRLAPQELLGVFKDLSEKAGPEHPK
jgi:hypothetical protein